MDRLRVKIGVVRRGRAKPRAPHTPRIRTGGFVFHFPLVKSGKSTGRLRSATDFSLSAVTTLQVAASYTSKSGGDPGLQRLDQAGVLEELAVIGAGFPPAVPTPEPTRSRACFQRGCSYSARYFEPGSHLWLWSFAFEANLEFGEAADDPARALHEVRAAVRAREVGVVLEDDRDPVRGPDQAGVHVAVDVLPDPLGMALGEVLLRVEVHARARWSSSTPGSPGDPRG